MGDKRMKMMMKLLALSFILLTGSAQASNTTFFVNATINPLLDGFRIAFVSKKVSQKMCVIEAKNLNIEDNRITFNTAIANEETCFNSAGHHYGQLRFALGNDGDIDYGKYSLWIDGEPQGNLYIMQDRVILR